jgi:hypothetical protein
MGIQAHEGSPHTNPDPTACGKTRLSGRPGIYPGVTPTEWAVALAAEVSFSSFLPQIQSFSGTCSAPGLGQCFKKVIGPFISPCLQPRRKQNKIDPHSSP